MAWLSVHPDRNHAWLRKMLNDGFHVHHVDGDHSNNSPVNLILMDGQDHFTLHAGVLAAGIGAWRKGRAAKTAVVHHASVEGERIYQMKAADPRPWKAFAVIYHGGKKPSPELIWSDVGVGMQASARAYARRSGLAWPP